LVWTSGGLLTAKELHNNLSVKSVETIDGIKPILNRTIHKNNPVVKVSMAQSISIKCTPDHPLYTKNGWTFAENLKNTDWVLTAFNRNSFPENNPNLPVVPEAYGNCKGFNAPSVLNNNIARLIGYYVAEGHINKGDDTHNGYTVLSVGKESKIIEEIERLCLDLGIVAHYYGNDNAFHINNILFTEWFKEVIGWEHNGAHLKEIPLIIRQSSKEAVLEFLVGYLADGFIMKRKLTDSGNLKPIAGWSSISENLLIQLQQLLFNLGVKSRLVKKKYGKHPKHHDGTINNCEFKYELLVEGKACAELAKLIKDRVVLHKEKWEWASNYEPKQNNNGNPIFSSIAFCEDEKGTWLKCRGY
jgi:intein/homing endonuclease